MNRAERRRTGKAKEPTYVLTQSQINQMKKEITDDAIEKAMNLMLGIPTMVIHDKFPKLIKLNVDGKNRETRFVDEVLELWDSFEKGYITLDDVNNCLFEECEYRIEHEKTKRIYDRVD